VDADYSRHVGFRQAVPSIRLLAVSRPMIPSGLRRATVALNPRIGDKRSTWSAKQFGVCRVQRFPTRDRAQCVIPRDILVGWRQSLPFHFIVRFEPLPGKEGAFRDELLRVNEPSRAEPGCLRIDVFESLREPFVFAIYSEWVDEESFELHATLPHTVRFLAAAEKLLTHPVQGLRLRHIGGGAGAGSG
jgi:quinol monooxygenase YgiN